jgi:uncharacterized DUF497 family protein
MLDLERIEGFDWDEGNTRKSAEKHQVSQGEAEQIFFNDPLLITEDTGHSNREPRLHALGHADSGRLLHITFTLRNDDRLIRVISAGPCIAENGYAMSKSPKSVPKFRSEAEERRFWETHDSSDYVDWSKTERVRLPNLKPSTTSISLRLPVTLLDRIKVAANKRDVPYQSLIKTWLAEKTDEKASSR